MKATPIRAGVGLAVLAALAFGATMPFIEHAARRTSPFIVAALLYGGAAAAALVLGGFERKSTAPRLGRAHLGRIVAIALLGGGLAPVALAWGIVRTGAATASLLLNLEAVFTVLLAAALYREPIGRRVAIALVVMAGGGAALTWSATTGSTLELLGVGAVSVATVAWAADNTLTRALSELRPLDVVAAKGTLGAAVTTIVALLSGASSPPIEAVAILVACGATGYGLSLRFYLLAQRRIGAARTGSVFAFAPLVGAALSWALGSRQLDAAMIAATVLFAIGVLLHVTEKHAHRHAHARLEHDHVHHHEDGHHDHLHDPPFVGAHAHAHVHEPIEHDHEHAPDLHHRHDHP